MEKLEELLLPVVEKAIEYGEQAGEFLIQETPLLIQEFLMWKTVSKSLTVLICAILTWVAIYWIRKAIKEDQSDSYAEWPIAAYAIVGIFGVVASVIFIVEAFTLIKILTAPKIYLLEYFLN